MQDSWFPVFKIIQINRRLIGEGLKYLNSMQTYDNNLCWCCHICRGSLLHVWWICLCLRSTIISPSVGCYSEYAYFCESLHLWAATVIHLLLWDSAFLNVSFFFVFFFLLLYVFYTFYGIYVLFYCLFLNPIFLNKYRLNIKMNCRKEYVFFNVGHRCNVSVQGRFHYSYALQNEPLTSVADLRLVGIESILLS